MWRGDLDEQYMELAQAIVRRASMDYLALYYIKRRMNKPSYIARYMRTHEEEEYIQHVVHVMVEIKRIERFFREDMPLMYDIDPGCYIKRLREMSKTKRLLPDIRLRREKL